MNLRQIRKKIKSINNVRKITKAMQLVSAVKMKKSQQLAIDGMLYRQILENIIRRVIPLTSKDYSLLQKAPENSKNQKLIIVISTNKGLCGAFNFNLFKFLLKNYDLKNQLYITVGKKGGMFISKMGGKIIASFNQTPFINNVSAIFETSLTQFLQGEVNEISLVYNHFINSFKFEAVSKLLLPISLEQITSTFEKEKTLSGEYLIEPSPREIIDSLIKSYIEEMIRGAILESEAGEHSARMLAMKNATDNAEDVIYNLTLLRNKIRQEKITYELLDMVTAKESMEITS